MGTRPISGDPIGNKKAPRGGLPIDHSIPGDHDRASLPGPRWLSPSPRPARMIPQAAGPALDSPEPPEDA